jgi:hypothetical protein
VRKRGWTNHERNLSNPLWYLGCYLPYQVFLVVDEEREGSRAALFNLLGAGDDDPAVVEELPEEVGGHVNGY